MMSSGKEKKQIMKKIEEALKTAEAATRREAPQTPPASKEEWEVLKMAFSTSYTIKWMMLMATTQCPSRC